jgi:DNA-binding MarR family transcriptional regulator
MNVHMQGIPYARASMVTRTLVRAGLIEATGLSRARCELYRVTPAGLAVIDGLDEKWKAQEERSR